VKRPTFNCRRKSKAASVGGLFHSSWRSFSSARLLWNGSKSLKNSIPKEGRDEGEFVGTAEEREETRLDINAGRGTFFAFQFAIAVVNSFEEAGHDREQPFVFRLNDRS